MKVKETIVARGYHKFFNLGEREETKLRNLKEDKINYPLYLTEKANGFLGILSVYEHDQDDLRFWVSSKTSLSGDFAKVFNDLIEGYLTDELKLLLWKNNVSVLFEVIEPKFDPHIEKYQEPELVILDVVKNIIEFELDDSTYEEVRNLMINMYISNKDELTLVRAAKKAAKISTWSNFNKFLDEVNSKEILSNDGVEGYVVKSFSSPEDKSPFMFKIKTEWYKFWKRMRGLKDSVYKKIQIRVIENPEKAEEIYGMYVNDLKNSIRISDLNENKFLNFLLDLSKKLPNDNDFINLKEIDIITLREKFLDNLSPRG